MFCLPGYRIPGMYEVYANRARTGMNALHESRWNAFSLLLAASEMWLRAEVTEPQPEAGRLHHTIPDQGRLTPPTCSRWGRTAIHMRWHYIGNVRTVVYI